MTDARWPELRTFQPGVIPLGPLQFGEIFRATLSTLRTHAAVLFGAAFPVILLTQLAALVVLPDAADYPVVPADATPEQALAALIEGFLLTLRVLPLALLVQVLVAGIATVVVGKAVLGAPIDLGQAWGELRPRLLPLLGTTAIVVVGVVAGLMLCVLPGVWLMVLLSLATPALVLERTGVLASLRRSRDLVRGAWWQVFAILLVAVLLTNGLSTLITLPFDLLGGSPGEADHLVLSTVGSVVAGTITAPITAVVTALVYVDRRMRTDDLALELARAAGMAPPDAGPTGTPHRF